VLGHGQQPEGQVRGPPDAGHGQGGSEGSSAKIPSQEIQS